MTKSSSKVRQKFVKFWQINSSICQFFGDELRVYRNLVANRPRSPVVDLGHEDGSPLADPADRPGGDELRGHPLLDRVAVEAPRRLEVVGDVGRDRDAVVAVAHEDLCVNQPVSRAGAASEAWRRGATM